MWRDPRWRDLALLLIAGSTAGATISLGVPLITLVLERAGVDAFWIGVNSIAGGLAVFVIGALVGRLVRLMGAVRTLQLALAAAALVLLLFPLKIDLVLWFGLRFVLGCCAAALFILSEAGVNALAPAELRGRVVAVYATTFSIGYAAGPLILAVVGSQGWTPFVVGSTLLLASTAPLFFARQIDAVLAPPATPDRRGDLIAVVRHAPLPFAGCLAFSVLETAFFVLLPLYALDRGLDERVAATLLSVWIGGNILLQFPLGWLGDRHGKRPLLLACALVAAATLLLTPLAIDQPHARWPLFLVMGAAMGGIYTMSLSILGERFRASELTRANTAFVMAYQVGIMAGPAGFGAAMRGLGAGVLPLALLVPVVAVGLATVAALRRRGRA
jgi:MFS family permease